MYDYQNLDAALAGHRVDDYGPSMTRPHYSLPDLIDTLAAMMSSFQPQLIATQDFVNTFGDGDQHGPLCHRGPRSGGARKCSRRRTILSVMRVTHNFARPKRHWLPSRHQTGRLLHVRWLRRKRLLEHGHVFDDGISGMAGAAVHRRVRTGGVVANAGFAQTVDSGVIVQLDGSMSSEQSGLPLTYEWTQTAGQPVTLSSTTIVNRPSLLLRDRLR